MHIAPLVIHADDVIQPVGKRNVVQPGVALANLLVVSVQVAQHQFQVGHGLAVQLKGHAQYAVCAGVLRPHVDDDLVGLDLIKIGDAVAIHIQLGHTRARRRHHRNAINNGCAIRGIVARRNRHRHILHSGIQVALGVVDIPHRIKPIGVAQVVGPWHALFQQFVLAARPTVFKRLGLALKIGFLPIFAHGPAMKALPQQDAPQIGVPLKRHAIHVIHLTFLVFRAGVNRYQRGHRLRQLNASFAGHACF